MWNFFIILISFEFLFQIQAEELDFIYENHKALLENDDFFLQNIEIKKIDLTKFLVKGTVDQLQDINENMIVELKSFRSDKADDEKKPTQFKFEKNVCEFIKGSYLKYIYPHFKNTSNLPDGTKCDIKKEKYVINDTEFNVKPFKMFLKPGYWRSELFLKDGETVKSGIIINGHIIKKE